jgi:hypothetical protein
MQLRGSARGIGSSRPTAARHRQTTCRVVCRASATSASSTTFGGQQQTPLTAEQVQKRQKQLQDLVQEAVKISLETGGLVLSGVYCSWLEHEPDVTDMCTFSVLCMVWQVFCICKLSSACNCSQSMAYYDRLRSGGCPSTVSVGGVRSVRKQRVQKIKSICLAPLLSLCRPEGVCQEPAGRQCSCYSSPGAGAVLPFSTPHPPPPSPILTHTSTPNPPPPPPPIPLCLQGRGVSSGACRPPTQSPPRLMTGLACCGVTLCMRYCCVCRAEGVCQKPAGRQCSGHPGPGAGAAGPSGPTSDSPAQAV